MGRPAGKVGRATYADVEAAPPNMVAELIRGTLHVKPRPAPRHARASSSLGVTLGGPFDHGMGGPGGWWILDEPEIHFAEPSPAPPGSVEVIVPDLAGWRRARMPQLPETAYFALAPDWICEVLSTTSTEDRDRNEKMPVYAREGVAYAWLVDPVARTLEAYVLGPDRRWGAAGIHRGAALVRVPPFEAVEIRSLAAVGVTQGPRRSFSA